MPKEAHQSRNIHADVLIASRSSHVLDRTYKMDLEEISHHTVTKIKILERQVLAMTCIRV